MERILGLSGWKARKLSWVTHADCRAGWRCADGVCTQEPTSDTTDVTDLPDDDLAEADTVVAAQAYEPTVPPEAGPAAQPASDSGAASGWMPGAQARPMTST